MCLGGEEEEEEEEEENAFDEIRQNRTVMPRMMRSKSPRRNIGTFSDVVIQPKEINFWRIFTAIYRLKNREELVKIIKRHKNKKKKNDNTTMD